MKQKDSVIVVVITMIMVLLNSWINDYTSDIISLFITPLVAGIGMTLIVTISVRAILIDQGFEKRDALVPYPMIALTLLAFSALFFLIFGVIKILF